MAKTKGRPGPKPGSTKKYGNRKDYHILLPVDVQEGESVSLADAFEKASRDNGGVVAYATRIIRERSEIRDLLK